jgi:hypothetical protein
LHAASALPQARVLSSFAKSAQGARSKKRHGEHEKSAITWHFIQLAKIAISATMHAKNYLQSWGTESDLHQQQQKQCAKNLASAGHIR